MDERIHGDLEDELDLALYQFFDSAETAFKETCESIGCLTIKRFFSECPHIKQFLNPEFFLEICYNTVEWFSIHRVNPKRQPAKPQNRSLMKK